MVSVMKHRNELPRHMVNAPFMEIFKTKLDGVSSLI